jgi:uncharacterized membrane protein
VVTKAVTKRTRPAAPWHHWSASVAVLAALCLYVALPDKLLLGPRWLIAALELFLLVLLNLVRRYHWAREEAQLRILSTAVVALLNLANVASVALLVDHLLYGGITEGRPLLYGAVSVWLTNVIVFALWFWELDRGGPAARDAGSERHPDFLFPQMVSPEIARPAWRPGFTDYLYVALTNAAAFSPTDTMPLTPASKALMSMESIISIVTVGIVAARAVNILS